MLRAGTLGAITDSSQVQEGQALPQPGAKQQVTSGGGGGAGKEGARGASPTSFDPHGHLRRTVFSQFQTGPVRVQGWSQSWEKWSGRSPSPRPGTATASRPTPPPRCQKSRGNQRTDTGAGRRFRRPFPHDEASKSLPSSGHLRVPHRKDFSAKRTLSQTRRRTHFLTVRDQMHLNGTTPTLRRMPAARPLRGGASADRRRPRWSLRGDGWKRRRTPQRSTPRCRDNRRAGRKTAPSGSGTRF